MIDIIKIRRDLHKFPELGFEEYKTQKYIYNIVKNYDCEIHFIKTGIIVFFNNNKDNSLAYRCDMDGLKIEELNKVEYKSTNNNMHACGHDAHMAIAIGICDYLNENYKKYNHNFVIIFQPSEESFGGSKEILDSKILSILKVQNIIAIHLFPKIKEKMFLTSKTIFGSAREINITLKGKSVHVANRKKQVDCTSLSIKIIKKITSLSSKNTLIHVGEIQSGISRNTTSPQSVIKGTIRSKKGDLIILNKIEKYLNKIKKKHKISISFDASSYLPMINNSPILIDKAKKLIPLTSVNHTFFQGEDFSLYSSKYSTLYILVGLGDVDYLHSPTFNFDESILIDAFDKIIKLLSIN